MNTNYITDKAKTIIFFCLFLTVSHLSAQNQGTYKYITIETPDDLHPTVLEANNHYYLHYHIQNKPTVTIFDEDLNEITKVLPLGTDTVVWSQFFYDKKCFYLIGTTLDSVSEMKVFFAKFDTAFNLVQSITYHDLAEVQESWIVSMTKKNEFLMMNFLSRSGLLLHINNNGELLQEVSLLPNGLDRGQIVETDSHYIINYSYTPVIHRFCKDSLAKYETLTVPWLRSGFPEGTAVTVGNQLIRSEPCDTYRTDTNCETGVHSMYYSLLFVNEDMSLQNRLIVGKPCVMNHGENQNNMHYSNPDSIYYVYGYNSNPRLRGNNIGIANFSWEGKLNFEDYVEIGGEGRLLTYITGCRALSNGGILVCGDRMGVFDKSHSVCLLLYHPPKGDVGVQEHTISERQISPNPTQSQFIVSNAENTDIALFNILGQKVLQTRSTEENAVIHVGFLPQGLYVLKVRGEGVSSTHKIQIVR